MKKVKMTLRFASIMLALTVVFEVMASAATVPNDKNMTSAATVKEKPKYNVSQLIVKYKDSYSWDKIKTTATKNDGLKKAKKINTLKEKNTEVIDVSSPDNMDSAIKELQKTPGVILVAPNYQVKAYCYSDNPMFSQQWALNNTAQTVNGQVGTAGRSEERRVGKECRSRW